MDEQKVRLLARTGLILTIICLAIIIVGFLQTGDDSNTGIEALLPDWARTLNARTYPLLLTFSYTFPLTAVALTLGITALAVNNKSNVADKKVALITIILSSILLLTLLFSAVAYMYSLKQIASGIDTRSSSERVQDALEEDVSITFGSFNPSTSPQGQSIMEVDVTVTNKKDEAQDYIIVFDVLDSGGNRIAENSVYTSQLNAKQTDQYKASFYKISHEKLESLDTATFKITSIVNR